MTSSAAEGDKCIDYNLYKYIQTYFVIKDKLQEKVSDMMLIFLISSSTVMNEAKTKIFRQCTNPWKVAGQEFFIYFYLI